MSREFLLLKYRSLLRRLGVKGELDSFPFISGDAFRIRCDVDLTSTEFRDLSSLDLGREYSIFLPVGKFDSFFAWTTNQNLRFKNWNLIIHNGDFNPDTHQITELSSYFKRIFAVNWTGPANLATPIPIGLENRTLRRNGVPRDFKKLRKLNNKPESDHLLLVSFKEANNISERGSLMQKFRGFPGAFIPNRFLPPLEYKKLLSDSRFVVSPPGNGIDCHRTWEAIYLRTTPIVIKRAWPFASLPLPVLCIDHWDELESLDLTILTFVYPTPIEIWNMFMLEPFRKSHPSK